MVPRPPEHIVLDDVGVVARRARVSDLDAIQAAIELSRDHLRPFMFWADQSRDETASFLAAGEASWDEDRDYGYVIVDAADQSILGGGGLHRRGTPDAIEVGYWRRVDAGGRGIVTALARALTTAGLVLEGVQRVEIHCDVANEASAAVPRRLGFRMERIIDTPPKAPGDTGRHMVWISPDGWDGSLPP